MGGNIYLRCVLREIPNRALPESRLLQLYTNKKLSCRWAALSRSYKSLPGDLLAGRGATVILRRQETVAHKIGGMGIVFSLPLVLKSFHCVHPLVTGAGTIIRRLL